MPSVKEELEGFKAWRTVAVNLNRGHPVEPIEDETFDGNDRPRVLGFMGFVSKFVLGGGQPSIRMYTHRSAFLSFVSFLVNDREASAAYVRSHISTAITVLDFLKNLYARPDEVPKVQDLIAAYQRLHRQASEGRRPSAVG
jgi:hypothetical protein